MSLILAPRNPKEARRVSLAKAGPYAATLLIRERVVIVEWEGPEGSHERCTARLGGNTRVGHPLPVQLLGQSDLVLPRPGALVSLVVPAPNLLWRFTTTVQDTVPGQLTLGWPLEVLQETGRRFARAECMLAVTLAVGSWQGLPDSAWMKERAICTYTLDVSMGGAQLALPRMLTVGTPVRLALRLPRESIQADATVAWTRVIRDEPEDSMYATGVQFAHLAPMAARRLRAMLGMTGAS